MTSKQPVNAPLILTTGAISVLLLVVIMFGVEAWYRYEERAEIEDKWAHSPNTALANLRLAQAEHITKGVTPDGKQVMPVAAAMELLVKNHGKMPATQPAADSAKSAEPLPNPKAATKSAAATTQPAK